MKQLFRLIDIGVRHLCCSAIMSAPEGWSVKISAPKRTDGQNERFHAICGDIAKSGLMWAGKKRTAAQWKVLLVSAHATATNEGSEMVQGLEGEFVNIRESTALMSVKRGASLIEYSTAFALTNGVRLMAPKHMYEDKEAA